MSKGTETKGTNIYSKAMLTFAGAATLGGYVWRVGERFKYGLVEVLTGKPYELSFQSRYLKLLYRNVKELDEVIVDSLKDKGGALQALQDPQVQTRLLQNTKDSVLAPIETAINVARNSIPISKAIASQMAASLDLASYSPGNLVKNNSQMLVKNFPLITAAVVAAVYCKCTDSLSIKNLQDFVQAGNSAHVDNLEANRHEQKDNPSKGRG